MSTPAPTASTGSTATATAAPLSGATIATTAHTIMDSPIGLLTLVTREGGLAGVYMAEHRHIPPRETFGPQVGLADLPVLAATAEHLAAYFAGERPHFDHGLSVAGTPFQRRVWEALRDIPYGETDSYGELAAALGQPTASRAVGLANGRNPVSIIVPCHRVVGADGSMTGYGGGLERKRWLLGFEGGSHQPELI